MRVVCLTLQIDRKEKWSLNIIYMNDIFRLDALNIRTCTATAAGSLSEIFIDRIDGIEVM